MSLTTREFAMQLQEISESPLFLEFIELIDFLLILCFHFLHLLVQIVSIAQKQISALKDPL
jgi:hypothetical protein